MVQCLECSGVRVAANEGVINKYLLRFVFNFGLAVFITALIKLV